jgi:hypothetical protein
MDIKFFLTAVILSFVTVLSDITIGANYVFILIVLGMLSFSVSYYYKKFKEQSKKTKELLNQTKSQFVENSEELAEAYKQLIDKDNAISSAADVISTKIGNSVSIVNSYLNLIKEEELSQDETDIFINKILEETEKIAVDTGELVKDLTGKDGELMYEQVDLGDFIKSVIQCALRKVKITKSQSVVIPCDRQLLEKAMCDLFKQLDKDLTVEYFTIETPRSIISPLFAKVTVVLDEQLELTDKEKETIFAVNPARNTKKIIKALNKLRKAVEKHNGNFWLLTNENSTVLNLTIPVNPKFVS